MDGVIPIKHRARRAISQKLRFEILRRDGFTCQYCGHRPPEVRLQVDHIHPVSKGGTNDPANLKTACFDCNIGKGTRSEKPPGTIFEPVCTEPECLTGGRINIHYFDGDWDWQSICAAWIDTVREWDGQEPLTSGTGRSP